MSLTLRVAVPAVSRSDQELVALVRRGDETAFEALYRRYARRVSAYVRGMVRDDARAEDITQEVFISALRRMGETDRPIAFKPWIYEIAKNACIDSARRSRRRQEVPLELGQDSLAADRAPLAKPPTPEAVVEAKQQLVDLRGAFGALSESHHQMLVMRELEGRSYQEIGERMGVSRPIVESTLFRARRRLGEEYEEIVSGRRCEQVRSAVGEGASRALGLRERRKLARHLAHCQACRRCARLAGFEHRLLDAPRVDERIAALVPIFLLGVRPLAPGRRSGPESAVSASRWHSSTIAHSASTLATAGDPAGAAGALHQVAAALAILALAGAGDALVSPADAPGVQSHRSTRVSTAAGSASLPRRAGGAGNAGVLAGRHGTPAPAGATALLPNAGKVAPPTAYSTASRSVGGSGRRGSGTPPPGSGSGPGSGGHATGPPTLPPGGPPPSGVPPSPITIPPLPNVPDVGSAAPGLPSGLKSALGGATSTVQRASPLDHVASLVHSVSAVPPLANLQRGG